MNRIFILSILFVLATVLSGCGMGHRLQYSQRFDEASAIGEFEFSDAAVWTLAGNETGYVLESSGVSSYNPPADSPKVVAIINDRVFGNFRFEADFMQTAKEYARLDICILFGIRDASHFYYAHITGNADSVAHSIYVVNGTDRTSIATSVTDGVEWDRQQWHKIRVVRKIDGLIKVYFDNSKAPVMSAGDTTFPSGYIGVGSFNDGSMIDNIKIYADDMLIKKSRVFEK